MKNLFNLPLDGYRNFKLGIANFWRWKRIIWNDRWWDHHFFYEMMLFKLQDMESHWGKDTNRENDKDVKLILQSLIEDLKKLQEDDFVKSERDALDIEYGKLTFIQDTNVRSERLTLILVREKETPQNKEDIKRKTIELYTLEETRQTATKHKFFDTLRDNIDRFWD